MAARRIQVLLAPGQAEPLESRARLSGRTKSDLVREAVAVVVVANTIGVPVVDGEPPSTCEDDPFLALIGAFDDDATEISERHDAYLYGAEMKP